MNEFLNLNLNPTVTVALPVYNSKKIFWLSLESLSNQINIDFDWELIVYEEKHENSICEVTLPLYIEKLKSVRCSRILFLTSDTHVPLIDKWIEIGKNSSESSKMFVLHAADCYSPKTRLKNSFDKIVVEDYDWYDQTKGYFYSFISDRIVIYDYNGLTNLNMSLKTKFIKTLPKSNLKKGIDGYIYNHCQSLKKIVKYSDDTFYDDSVDTHGLNNISVNREEFFETKPQIFKITNLELTNTSLPKNIVDRLFGLYYDNKPVETTVLISTYKNVDFLNECIDSILKSTSQINTEILIGIDKCDETLEFVKTQSYPHKVKFFYFNENVGPYVVFNSLSKISKGENLIFFGSDDVMGETMITEITDKLKKCDVVKPKYVNFNDGEDYTSVNNKIFLGEGVFGVKKEIFNYMNGFEPWRCSADTDFMVRLYKNNYKVLSTNSVSFYRRIHKNSLTQSEKTGYSSQIRGMYSNLIDKRTSFKPLEYLVTKPFIDILTNKINDYIYDEIIIKPTNYEIVMENLNKTKPFNPIKVKKEFNNDLINNVLSRTDIYHPSKNIKPQNENKPTNRNELAELKKSSLMSSNVRLFHQKRVKNIDYIPISKPPKRNENY